jgi:intracellular multiplication protein IcmC
MKTVVRITLIVAISVLLSSCEHTNTGDLASMLMNVQKNLQPVWQMLVALSYTLGIIFVGVAIFKLKQYGQMTVMMSTHASLGGTMAYFLVGIGLLFLPTLLNTWMITAWAYNLDDISGTEAGHYADFLKPITQIIQVIGLISFLRGWISLTRLGGGGQPGTLSKGIMHIVGGILAINVTGTIDMLKATMGIT